MGLLAATPPVCAHTSPGHASDIPRCRRTDHPHRSGSTHRHPVAHRHLLGCRDSHADRIPSAYGDANTYCPSELHRHVYNRRDRNADRAPSAHLDANAYRPFDPRCCGCQPQWFQT